jgi:hypothetical protein
MADVNVLRKCVISKLHLNQNTATKTPPLPYTLPRILKIISKCLREQHSVRLPRYDRSASSKVLQLPKKELTVVITGSSTVHPKSHARTSTSRCTLEASNHCWQCWTGRILCIHKFWRKSKGSGCETSSTGQQGLRWR